MKRRVALRSQAPGVTQEGYDGYRDTQEFVSLRRAPVPLRACALLGGHRTPLKPNLVDERRLTPGTLRMPGELSRLPEAAAANNDCCYDIVSGR